MQKIINFIKYNNAAVIILALILILGGGALAAGPEAIGQKQTSLQGADNSLLLAADLDKLNMDFKIEKIEEDSGYYYVNYSYLDLAVINSAWQYQLSAAARKISKKIKEDLGEYLAKQLKKHYEARVRELKQAKALAEAAGPQTRVEVTAYSGLIGKTLDAVKAVFPGYEPVKKRELAAPEFNPPNPPLQEGQNASGADNLTQIYNNYLSEHPEVISQLDAVATSTPEASGGSTSSLEIEPLAPPASAASSTPAATPPPLPPLPEGIDASSTPAEPASVQVIELPAPVAAEPPAPDAPAETAPAPAPEPALAEPAPAAETTAPMP
ncbi:MAG: hypothetical protein Q7R92_00575 [bacterium]|nr:hypothetical protein [bacterium]